METVSDVNDDVQRAAGGDAQAFERLYRATVARVHGLARRLLGDPHADDATQEVYLRAWTRLAGFRGESAFATWLHRLALNVLLARRSAALGGAEDGERELAQVAERRASEPGLALDLEQLIQGLPRGARDVFVLHDVEGLDHAEVAALLGVSSGTSKSQLHRARTLLRARFEPASRAEDRHA